MKRLLFLLFTGFALMTPLSAQVTGLWRSTDHIDASEKSVVRIYEKNGKYYGEIVRLLPAATITHCSGCEGELKNKSLVGMMIMSDIKKKENGGADGKILDPSNGKFYSCDLELENPDLLKVTGYLGLTWLGKEMYWKRDKSNEK